MSSKDNLGDKLKYFEGIESDRHAIKGLPIMARLDGRSFSKFTKGLERPFDSRMSRLMQETTRFLVKETRALLGYTQSDEITLAWFLPYEGESEYDFGGKYQKLVSTYASLATGYFNNNLGLVLPEKANFIPTFDCRVWQVPTTRLVYLNFLWREQDATKNSISMAAHHYFSHKELQGKNSKEKIVMLESKRIDWAGYPTHFKRGSYFQRKSYLKPSDDGSELVERHHVTEINMPVLSTVANIHEVIFNSAEPILKEYPDD
jgi:tRNA(His) guanylyltransferase